MLSKIQTLKESIRARDSYCCVDCGITQDEYVRQLGIGNGPRRLDVHRQIADGPYNFENCKTLCRSCHCAYRRDYTGEKSREEFKAEYLAKKSAEEREYQEWREQVRASFA